MSSRYAGIALVVSAAVASATPKPGEKREVPTEVHVVVVHVGDQGGRRGGVGTAAVHVDRPGVEVTLVVSAYNPVAWDVTASPKTTVTRVILAGYHHQSATVPKGAQVIDYFSEGRSGKPYTYVYYKADSPRFRPGIQALHELTKQQVRSFQGTYQYNPAAPLVVNAIQDDPRLSTDHPRLSRTADLPKVAFRAVHLTPTDRFGAAGSYGDYTQAGPDKASLKPLPDKIVRLAHDPKGKKYYGLTDHEVHEVDVDKRTSTKLDPRKDVTLSWPRAIAFDTKRDRLLVVASHSLCEYDPAAGKWRAVAGLPRGLDLQAIAYHPKDDVLYGLGQDRGGEDGGRPVLHVLNPQGAVLKSTRLGEPMFTGVFGTRGPGSRAQLAVAGNHLAVLVGGSAPRGENGESLKAESFLFLIDPETEKVTLGWKE